MGLPGRPRKEECDIVGVPPLTEQEIRTLRREIMGQIIRELVAVPKGLREATLAELFQEIARRMP